MCSAILKTNNPRLFFCQSCYNTYKDNIDSGADWITYCVNWEQRRRYQHKLDKKQNLVYGLGDLYDLAITDTGYKLVLLKQDDSEE